MGSGPGKARMDMTVDGNDKFPFYTDGLAAWEVKTGDGSSLSFNSIMVDQHGDNHGYMVLRITVNKLMAGKALTIRVTGSQANFTS